MSSTIIASLRTQTQLRGNTFLVAVELAHRMNDQGYGAVSYQFLAWKAHCCRRTAITQIARLIALGIITKTVIRTREGYAWNHYRYLGPRLARAFPPATTHGATSLRTLPDPEREKNVSATQHLERQRTSLRFLTPGSGLWERTQEEIARLESLRRC